MKTEAEKFLKKSGMMEQPLRRDVLGTDYWRVRREFIQLFGFAILDYKTVKLLRRWAPYIEVGAGTGYWTHELRRAQVHSIATDIQPEVGSNDYGFKKKWARVVRKSALMAAVSYPKRSLLMCWPCLNDPWSVQTVKAYKGSTVVYVGESRGGCTASEEFFDEMEAHWKLVKLHHIPQFPGIHDYLHVYQRRKTDRRAKA